MVEFIGALVMPHDDSIIIVEKIKLQIMHSNQCSKHSCMSSSCTGNVNLWLVRCVSIIKFHRTYVPSTLSDCSIIASSYPVMRLMSVAGFILQPFLAEKAIDLSPHMIDSSEH